MTIKIAIQFQQMSNLFKKIFSSSTSRDTIFSMAGVGVISLVGMLFTVIMARSLEPGPFGVFSAITALVTILSSMGDFGLSSALINFLPKLKDQRKELISVSFWFQLVVSAFFILSLIILGFWNQFIIPGSSSIQFALAGILIAVYIVQGLSVAIFSADKKFIQSSVVQASDSILKMLLVLAVFFKGALNIEIALIANIISCSISLIYGLKYELKNIRPIFPRQQLISIFNFAKWIALSRVFSTTISRVDILLLNLLAGNYQAGIFSAASRIALLFALLVSSLGNVIAPRFSSFNNHQDIKTYLKKVSMLVGAICLFMLICVLLAQPLILFVFGDKYLPAIPVFRALTFAMIPFLLSIITTQPLIYYFNKPNFFARLTILQVVTIVTLDLLLIPRFQAMAPAISLGIANTLVVAISGYKLNKLIRE